MTRVLSEKVRLNRYLSPMMLLIGEFEAQYCCSLLESLRLITDVTDDVDYMRVSSSVLLFIIGEFEANY